MGVRVRLRQRALGAPEREHERVGGGVGPVAVDVAFESSAVPTADFAKLLGGSFKVVIRGPAAATFSTKGAQANLQVTFTFAAFE